MKEDVGLGYTTRNHVFSDFCLEVLPWCIGALVFSAWLVWGPPQVMRGLDYAMLHHFLRDFLAGSIRDGELPLWNPYILMGEPFLANPEVAAFYPPSWLVFVFPEAVAYWLEIALHLALAGWSMHRLVKAWGAPRAVSVFAGLAYVVSQPFLGRLEAGGAGFVFTLTWWPLALWIVDRLCDEASLRGSLMLSLVLAAAFLAGQSHAFWLILCSLGFFAVPRCLYGDVKNSARRLGRFCLFYALAGAMTFCLVGVEMLPLMELSSQSNRVVDKVVAASFPLGVNSLKSLFVPISISLAMDVEHALYGGLAVTVFGCVFLLLRPMDRRGRALLFLTLVCLILGLGERTFLFDAAYPFIPGMGCFRECARFGAFIVFSLILATSLFWRDMWRVSTRIPVRTLFYVFFALWAADYIPAAVRLGSDQKEMNVIGGVDCGEHVSAAARRLANGRKDAVPIRVFAPVEIVKPDAGMLDDYCSVSGYGSLHPIRTWYYLHIEAKVAPSLFSLTYLDPRVYQGKNPFPYEGADVALVWSVTEGKWVAAPPKESSRAWLVGRVEPEPDWADAVFRMARERYNPRSGALLEPSDYDDVAKDVHAPVSGDARVTGFTRNTITVEARADRSSVLVLAESWFPGWHARIDGVNADVFPANAWMRGVVVPAGSHKVEFYFRSTWLVSGAALSVAALLVWILLWRRGGGCAQ